MWGTVCTCQRRPRSSDVPQPPASSALFPVEFCITVYCNLRNTCCCILDPAATLHAGGASSADTLSTMLSSWRAALEQQAGEADRARQQLAEQRAQWRAKVGVMQEQFQAAQALLQVSECRSTCLDAKQISEWHSWSAISIATKFCKMAIGKGWTVVTICYEPCLPRIDMQVLEHRASAHKAELGQERAATRKAEAALAAERAVAAQLKEQIIKWEGVAKVGHHHTDLWSAIPGYVPAMNC